MSKRPPAYEDWRQRLEADILSDPAAVGRDYPRMTVYVSSATQNNYIPINDTTVISLEESSVGSSVVEVELLHGQKTTAAAAAAAKRKSKDTNEGAAGTNTTDASAHISPHVQFKHRCMETLRTTQLLAQLCGEGNTYGDAFTKAWTKSLEQRESASDDVASLMMTALVESGMFEEVKMTAVMQLTSQNENDSGDTGAKEEAIDAHANADSNKSGKGKSRAPEKSAFATTPVHDYGTSAATSEPQAELSKKLRSVVPKEKVSYTLHGHTAHLLMYFVQGVMFYPVQRLRHLLWYSWAPHLQDISWVVHVSSKAGNSRDGDASEGSDGNNDLCILHKMITRSYVDEDDRKTVPQFEIEWECQITVEKENPANLRDACISITTARIVTPPKTLCWVSSTWTERKQQLEEHLQQLFSIPLEEVHELKKKKLVIN